MSWFRLDDKGAFHPKVVTAGNLLYGCWVRASQWSCHYETDGFIPRAVAFQIAEESAWQKLIEVGLCDPSERDGYQIHDFLEYNPSRKQNEHRRVLRAKAGKAGGQAKAAKQGAKQVASKLLASAKQAPSNRVAKVCPVPDPDPHIKEIPPLVPPSGGKRAKSDKTRVPPSEATDDEVRAWCERWKIPHGHVEVSRMLDHFRSKGEPRADWGATWRNWEKRAREFAVKANGHSTRILQKAPPGGSLWKVGEVV